RWALLDAVAPRPRHRERDEALAELARRYFTGHGPATVRDLAWWAGITLTDARAGLAGAAPDLERFDLDGESFFHRPGLEPARPAVHLLPGFDEYLLGYTDRSAPLAGEHTETIVPGGNGMFLATIVVNGEVVGTWRRSSSAKGVRVDVRPFGGLRSSVEAGIARAAKRYAAFLGRPLIG
ncbi:MAG TPA: winged helix DNA-binding domain-containing protein, partial [Pseudolysinimonas sp.]|nr:winged helix DNA-binding domain-containing protein [Pseudolysinimonas sp.]